MKNKKTAIWAIAILLLFSIAFTGCKIGEEKQESEANSVDTLWPYGETPSIRENISDYNIPEYNLSEEQKEALIQPLNELIEEYWERGLFEEQAAEYLGAGNFSIEGIAMPVIENAHELCCYSLVSFEEGKRIYDVSIVFGENNEWILYCQMVFFEENDTVSFYELNLARVGYVYEERQDFIAYYKSAINTIIEEAWEGGVFLPYDAFETDEQLYPPENISMPIVSDNNDAVIVAFRAGHYRYIINIPFGENNEWVMQIGVIMYQDIGFGPYVTFSRNHNV